MKAVFLHKLVYDYRVSFYEHMAQRLNEQLTVVHSGRAMLEGSRLVQEVVVPEIAWLGLRWQRRVSQQIKDADVVVALFDVHYLSSLWHFLCRRRSQRWIWWGIGFGHNPIANKLRVVLARRSDGVALYMPRNLHGFQSAGIPPELLAVAPNTVEVKVPHCNRVAAQRTAFLLLGSLKRRKQANLLIEAFARQQHRLPGSITLEFVGDGECRRELQEQAQALGVGRRTVFHGSITDESVLRPIFARSLAMVSPGQAGLSILHCFAAGVPVVTSAVAISGGELDNIQDNVNGMLYGPGQAVASLDDALELLANCPEESVRMGVNAHAYYCAQMTLGHLVDAFVQLLLRGREGRGIAFAP
jgi:glycosyltransferase involved in cell wall biosynthesis